MADGQLDWGDNFMDNIGGAKASGTEVAKDEISGDVSRFLDELSSRFDDI